MKDIDLEMIEQWGVLHFSEDVVGRGPYSIYALSFRKGLAWLPEISGHPRGCTFESFEL